MVNIAFTGGGTGGHIYPGLAVAAELRARLDCRIFWIGSRTGMDRTLVEGAGLEFFGVPSGRLRRYFSFKTVPDLFRVAAGFFAARKIFKTARPALLFSKGGFVSVPPCAAAASRGIPVFTHESDYSPGLATRINARFVSRGPGSIFTAYADTAAFFPPALRGRIRVSGNPVRPEFRAADPARGRAFLGLGSGERILLVLGGSQGAGEINELVWKSRGELTRWFTVVHQTGPGKGEGIRAGDRYLPFPYINEELPHVMAAAELVLGRSGAGTVWESAALGLPMALIPLRGPGTRGDQVENARFFERAGAALVLSGGELEPRTLTRALASIAEDREKRKAMAAASKRIGETNGAALIADSLCAFLTEKKRGEKT
ncbi:MAG: undecaprenyldiphospho-muramoylpentapeptide beta-N-acetylglucosaminyltransferase [Treponema sp.]|jgi:UDP-N-acetylglucosamine--N-acetylmuramyl-(pentapeptide) pyrophosphoryl-undecaprenol N-acetylglucosamine transferase|nr:undecaprenyldiphospho-muramoylpentapeptide beta-N-acetylglucosaminyltransferase [Treponema sp.]